MLDGYEKVPGKADYSEDSCVKKSEYTPREVAIEVLKKAESMLKAKLQNWDDHKAEEIPMDTAISKDKEVANQNDLADAYAQEVTENSVQRLKKYMEKRKAKKESK